MDRLNKVIFGTEEDSPRLNVDLNIQLGLRGLKGRVFLPDDECALFDMLYEDIHQFWMASVSFPLDLIFVDQNLKIVDVHLNCKAQDTTPITPKTPCRYIIEVNSGWAEDNDIEVGSKVRFENIWSFIK